MSKFIGKTVQLKKTIHKTKYGDMTSYKVDDPKMVAAIKKEHGTNIRIFPPGTMGTCDFVPSRTNVYIDETGVITRVSNG